MRYPYRIKRDDKQRAIEYICKYGRDIDIALCEYFFGRGNQYNVIHALSGYINDDGGFGKGLALDYLYEGSTPLATTHGMDIIRIIKVRIANHITSNALHYLEKVQCHNGSWCCINMKVNSTPRASWWEYEHEHSERYTLNPTAEIIGYYYLLGTGVYRHYANDMLDRCYSYLLDPHNCNQMNEIICLMKMVRMLPTSKASRFTRILKEKLLEHLCTDSSQYGGYVFAPLQVFEGPSDPLVSEFSNEIEDHLDIIIERQTKDGNWRVNYNWGRYKYEFDQQIPLIQAKITLDNLIKLDNFSRIT